MTRLTAPVNFNNSNKEKGCNEKCKYQHSYPTSNLIYKIKNEYLSFKPAGEEYDNTARLNTSYYSVKEIRIYKKAVHSIEVDQVMKCI